MSNSRDLTSLPIGSALLKLAGPMSVGIVAVFSISLADTYYVGRLGTQPLAALSFTFPVLMTIASFALGLGAGASSVVSRAIGGGNRDNARRLTTDALLLALIIVTLLCVLGWLTIRPLFSLLGAQGAVLDMIEGYMRIWYWSMPFLVVPMVANAIIRAVGDAFWPSVLMVLTAVTNILVTPVLIFGWFGLPALGIEGAALGTLVARVLELCFAIYLVIIREKLVSFRRPSPAELLCSWKRVLKVGLPASLGSMINPIAIAAGTAIVATFGDVAVAAFGVATRLESFASIPMLALSAAIGPIAGQNWGAHQRGRVTRALRMSYALCVGWALFLALLFWLTATFFADLLASEQAVAEEASRYLHIVPISLFGFGIVVVAAGGFNGLGKSLLGLAYYLTRALLLYVPLAWLGAQFWGITAVYYGIALANVLAGLAVAMYSLHWLRKHTSPPHRQNPMPATGTSYSRDKPSPGRVPGP